MISLLFLILIVSNNDALLTKKRRLPGNCGEALAVWKDDGIHKIALHGSKLKAFEVFCKKDPEEGHAWTVIQHRFNGSVDFNRNWTDYENGFGDLRGEFFLGLKLIHALTNAEDHELWIELEDSEGEIRFKKYTYFSIANAAEEYRLSIGKYYGNATDSLSYHDGMKFSTYNMDNDLDITQNCAAKSKGGWWFKDCYHSNLNGEYENDEFIKGIIWSRWYGQNYSLVNTRMSIRPSHGESSPYPKNCNEAVLKWNTGGVFKINVPGSQLGSFDVLCLRDKQGGHPFTVMQRRMNGTVNFQRDWDDYDWGFGELNGDFFLGLRQIYALTKMEDYELFIQMGDFEGEQRYALYSRFAISNIREQYTLRLGEYSGNAGDSLTYHNGMKFSTYDRDNDIDQRRNCAADLRGGWWFKACHHSNLNGQYNNNAFSEGINWRDWHGFEYSLRYTLMAIRPVQDPSNC